MKNTDPLMAKAKEIMSKELLSMPRLRHGSKSEKKLKDIFLNNSTLRMEMSITNSILESVNRPVAATNFLGIQCH